MSVLSNIYYSKKKKLINNTHFGILLLLIVTLSLFYSHWPWRSWTNQGLVEYSFVLTNLAVFELKYHFIGILFLIPILYGAIVLSLKGALLILILSLIGLLPTYIQWSNLENFNENIGVISMVLILPVVIVSAISLEIKRRAKERDFYQEREQQQQLVVKSMIMAQEHERQRIAQELHDETVQTLSVVASRLGNIATSNLDEHEIVYIKDIVNQTINELRYLSRDLRPAILDKFGIISAMNILIEQANQAGSTKIILNVLGKERKLNPTTQIHIFRIFQEALNNIKYHSKATKATVEIEFQPQQLRIVIQDNGQGFNVRETMRIAAQQNKLGLVGIYERTKIINGKLQLHSQQGQGTLLSLDVPYENENPGSVITQV